MTRKSPARDFSEYPTLFMLLDLNPQAYAWPIIVYSKQDMSQLCDDCKTFVKSYLTTLDIHFPRFF